MWIDKDLEPVVSFTFKGAGADWVTAQRHTNECVPRAVALLSVHTMGPFIAASWAAMAPASAVGESGPCGGKDQDLKRLYLLSSYMTLSEFWTCFGLTLPICKVAIMLVPSLRVIVKIQWGHQYKNIWKGVMQMPVTFSDGSLSACLLHMGLLAFGG